MPTLAERLTAFEELVKAREEGQDRQIAYFAEIATAILMHDTAWAEALTKALRGGDQNPDNATWKALPFE